MMRNKTWVFMIYTDNVFLWQKSKNIKPEINGRQCSSMVSWNPSSSREVYFLFLHEVATVDSATVICTLVISSSYR